MTDNLTQEKDHDDFAAAHTLSERLREASVRWSPGVDFGPDLLREAADKIDSLAYARSYLAEPDESCEELGYHVCGGLTHG